MEIRIEDYLDHNEIKEAALQVVKEQTHVLMKSEKDIQRIMMNQAYEMIWKMVDECFDEDIKDVITGKVKGLVTKFSSYSIFKKPDAWDREPNNAYNHLQKCIEDNFPRIKTIVDKNIEPQVLSSIKDSIDDHIITAVQDLYKTRREE